MGDDFPGCTLDGLAEQLNEVLEVIADARAISNQIRTELGACSTVILAIDVSLSAWPTELRQQLKHTLTAPDL